MNKHSFHTQVMTASRKVFGNTFAIAAMVVLVPAIAFAVANIPAACTTPGDCPDLTPTFDNVRVDNGYFIDGFNIFDTMAGKVEWMPTSTANFDDNIGIPLNGQTVVNGAIDYPALTAKINAGTIVGVATVAGNDLIMADYNQVGSAQGGYFLRGLGDRAEGALQAYTTARPTNPFTTNTTGNHNHSYNDRSNNSELSDDANDRTVGSDGKTDQGRTTGTSGNHSHSITGGGDAETAPKSVSGLWYVFALKAN